MSESKHNKGTSVAAFLFMPQFHLCFRGFSHIVPIFMRTLALMFAQAGLIDRNHPASRYGIEGVKKYSFAELMGEAWFSLRSQRADTRQWGMFISVVMMIVVFAAALITFLLNVFLGLGTAAHAQIFSHPGSPYNSGNQTDITTMAGSLTGPVPPMFDSRSAYDGGVGPGDATRSSTDLGLMLLDKVLRQSTVGEGGAMQNALAGLMQVYNTGVLVVAAVMIFWMILSIVVDTAKTGIVGGGRHNMVWTPIRVVFALGIMIPLGTTGFSSGQFAVMKLAEWGSNFGTQAWNGYVTGVINGSSLLSPFTAESASALADGLARIKVCQIAWNSEAAKQTNPIAANYEVVRSAPRLDNSTGKTVVRYTNATAGNLCGSISYTAGVSATSGSARDALPAAERGGVSQELHDALETFRDRMRVALTGDLAEGAGLMTIAHNFGCGFVGRFMMPNDGSANPAVTSGQCTAGQLNLCGANATLGSESFPNLTCHQAMINLARTQVTNAANGAGGAMTALTDYISGPLVADMTRKGWAGMGVWTYYIKILNDLALQAREINVTIQAGTMWDKPSQDWQGASPSTIEEFVKTVNTDYDRWWSEKMQTTDAQQAAYADRKASIDEKSVDWEAIEQDFKKTKSGKGMVDKIMRMILPDTVADIFSFDITGGGDLYPFTRLIEMGYTIMGMFISIMAALTLVEIAAGYFSGGSVSTSALAQGLHSGSIMGIMAGGMLAFYVPILPLIRTTFAALTWIISVFEAVVMVPMAALNFLTSVGEGMGARENWILWLNVLMRPVLVVIGFVGAMLAFNSFAVYFSANYANGVQALRTDMGMIATFFSYVAFTIIYVGAIYTAANTTFKMLDMIPDAMMRWMGGRADVSFTDDNTAGMMFAAGNLANSFKGQGNSMGSNAGAGLKNLKNKLTSSLRASDLRLKTDIQQVGHTVHALPLYQFRYIYKDGVYEGVMAQDVLKVMPEAVVIGKDGFYRVDYGMLGTAMRRIH